MLAPSERLGRQHLEPVTSFRQSGKWATSDSVAKTSSGSVQRRLTARDVPDRQRVAHDHDEDTRDDQDRAGGEGDLSMVSLPIARLDGADLMADDPESRR